MGFWSRFARTLRPGRHHADIDEEIAFHLEMKRLDGADRRAARLRFGNPEAIREDVRAAGSLALLESLMQDVRYGLRQLRRTPMLTAAVVASIGVGIAGNVAIFSLVDAALLRSLPVRDPASLVVLEWTADTWPEELIMGHTGSTDRAPSGHTRGSSVSAALNRRLAAQQDAFAAVIGFSDSGAASFSIASRPADQLSVAFVSANFFGELDVVPAPGRGFSREDDQVGADPVVVVSHRYWKNALGGRVDAVGQSVRVNGVPATVVGIAPAGFFGMEIGEWVDVYAPLAARVVLVPRPGGVALAEDDTSWWVRQAARVKPADTPAAATARLSNLFQQLAVPAGMQVERARVPTLVHQPGRRGFDPIDGHAATAFWALWLLVGLVLLIVCANVANLLLAQAVARQRESAVRLALGASRGRLVRQGLIESVLLAGIGAALGLWGGRLLADSIHTMLVDGFPSRGLDLQLDWRIALYAAGLSLLAALVFGLVPVLRQTHTSPNESLKAGSRTIASGHLRLPRVLVAAQIALCLTVLVSAGLLGRSLSNLRHADLGFDRDNVLYVSVNPWRDGMRAEHVGAFVERLRENLLRVPGVQRTATIASRPLSGSSSQGPANIPGRPFRDDGSDVVMVNELGDGGLEALGIALLAGRSFDARDMSPRADAVLVDDRFVARFFPDRYPVGQRFGFGKGRTDTYQIIGVVRSSRYNSLRADLRPTFYRPHLPAQRPGRDVHVVLRAGVDIAQLAPAIRRAASEVNPAVGVTELFTQTQLIDRLLYTDRLLGAASVAFGSVALLLAAIGLAGLLAYSVAGRTNEIGLRMAMGAAPGQVQWMVLRDALRLLGVGILLGLPFAWLVARLLQSNLFGVRSGDVWTSGGSVGILLIVAILATWLPARRAARVDPMLALREQ